MSMIGRMNVQPSELPTLAFVDRITATADAEHAEVTLWFHDFPDFGMVRREIMTICMRDAAAAVAYDCAGVYVETDF